MKNLEKIQGLKVEVKKTLTDIKANLLIDDQIVSIANIIKEIYNIEVTTNESEHLIVNGFFKGTTEDIYRFTYLEEGTFEIFFGKGIGLEISFDEEKYQIETLHINIANRLQKVINSIDKFLKENEQIHYIVPIELR